MKGFVKNIEKIARENQDFRQVQYTTKNCQLVIMSLRPKEEIGMEAHKLDQFFHVEEGNGEGPLKLYMLYTPPNYPDGVRHHTRADATADAGTFNGKTTE